MRVLLVPLIVALVATSARAADPDPTALPPKPQPSAALAPTVRQATALVNQIRAHCIGGSSIDFAAGVEVTVSPHCGAWVARLVTLGDGVAYAVLPGLGAAESDQELQLQNELMGAVGASRSKDAFVLLLHYLHAHAVRSDAMAPDPGDAMRALTGTDIAALRSGDPETPEAESAVELRAWLAWWSAHQGESVATWQATGHAAHVAALTSTDPWTRHLAVAAALASEPDREAVMVSLYEVFVGGSFATWTPTMRRVFADDMFRFLRTASHAEATRFLASAKAHHLPVSAFPGLDDAERAAYTRAP